MEVKEIEEQATVVYPEQKGRQWVRVLREQRVKAFVKGALWNQTRLQGLDDPFPLKDVLQHLVNASEHLLHKKSYDGGDYEEIGICINRAKEIITKL